MTEPSLDSELIEEVKRILSVDSPESLLQKDAEKFIEEEEEPSRPMDISEFETPSDQVKSFTHRPMLCLLSW